MPRKKSFSSILKAAARESARAQRRAATARKQREREYERVQRQAETQRKRQEREIAKTIKEAEKQAKQEYLESRLAEVEEINSEIVDWLQELKTVLEHTLEVNDTVSFEDLRIQETFPKIQIPEKLLTQIPSPQLDKPNTPPEWLMNLLPCIKRKHIEALKKADSIYQIAKRDYELLRKEQNEKLEQFQTNYERDKQAFLLKVQQRNAEVDELESAYRKGDPSAVATYNEMVLERSEYPTVEEYPYLCKQLNDTTKVEFPQQFRVAYVAESKQLVIDYELPTVNIIPSVAEVKYVKSKDEIQQKITKPTEIKAIYQDVIAAIALRTIHEVFEADQANLLDVVVFSGFVQTVDPATGGDIQPYLLSVRVIKERFNELDLSRIDKRVCLRNLGAQVSSQPAEMQPIKPIVEFNMVDPRFIEQEGNIISELESRPNLMDLNPSEFESFVASLFAQMGMETKLTRASKDGGVDAVAFDTRPILGGKVVIQAKRYSNTVGVSAVRDLYGTMMNEGANKGILVATSGYGPDAYDFAKDKPIELIDGSGLLYLLEEHTGIKARIIYSNGR